MINAQMLPLQRVEQARELFFEQGRDPDDWVAPHILRSWRRSRPVVNDDIAPTPVARAWLEERREQARMLLRCAEPELDGLAEHAVGNGSVVILADADGLILDEIGSPDFVPRAERIALSPGMEWSEGSRGTNAIGTALAERDSLLVLGREHYLPQNGAFSCAAAPVLTARGEVAGALDISGEAGRVGLNALGLVRIAAQQVEHRLMLSQRGGHDHLLRFHRRPALLGTAREGLVLIKEGRIVGANRPALTMLDRSWTELLDQEAEAFFGLHWSRLQRQRGLLALPGGQQIAAVVEMPPKAESTTVWSLNRVAPPQDDTSPLTDAVLPLLQRATRALDAGVPILVTGETGSGKEVFARRLHSASRRHAGAFVAVNCAALPETLIEAELFGYREGAFTGARRGGMPGRIREADGGVLFLDEIADMPLLLQARLLRVLEERVVHPLGGGQGTAVDFDLVCATHGDLPRLATSGQFRSDLMYRVAGFTVSLPPLHQRADRQLLISRLFKELGGDAKGLQLEGGAMERLVAYRWPGNVRELRSVLRSLTALAETGDVITAADLPAHLSALPQTVAELTASTIPTAPALLIELTRNAVDQALEQCGHDVSEAARRLGVHRSTVYRHLARKSKRPV